MDWFSDNDLDNAEQLFYSGEYKRALETTIRAIDAIEPGIHNKLLESVK